MNEYEYDEYDDDDDDDNNNNDNDDDNDDEGIGFGDKNENGEGEGEGGNGDGDGDGHDDDGKHWSGDKTKGQLTRVGSWDLSGVKSPPRDFGGGTDNERTGGGGGGGVGVGQQSVHDDNGADCEYDENVALRKPTHRNGDDGGGNHRHRRRNAFKDDDDDEDDEDDEDDNDNYNDDDDDDHDIEFVGVERGTQGAPHPMMHQQHLPPPHGHAHSHAPPWMAMAPPPHHRPPLYGGEALPPGGGRVGGVPVGKGGGDSAAARASYEARAANMPRWMIPGAAGYPGAGGNGGFGGGGSGGPALPPRPSASKLDMEYAQPVYLDVGYTPSSSGSGFGSGSGAFSWSGVIMPPDADPTTLPTSTLPSALPSSLTSAQARVELRPTPDRPRRFKLTLLSVEEFTVTALPTDTDYYHGTVANGGGVGASASALSYRPSLAGLRTHIKKISRQHGKAATFEKDTDDGAAGTGRWRIPLSAYHAFYAFLCSDPSNQVYGIPDYQLKIASIARERKDKGYPTKEDLEHLGVPEGLAAALAPYQRGGVDFVFDRDGRALIADEMGLGKTVQAIAAMSMYHEEWPVLVLTPSSARYHWDLEFKQWLGIKSPINQPKKKVKKKTIKKETNEDGEECKMSDNRNEKKNYRENAKSRAGASSVSGSDREDAPPKSKKARIEEDPFPSSLSSSSSSSKLAPTLTGSGGRTNGRVRPFPLLLDSQVRVLTSSKDPVIPLYGRTRVVICSYGLAPNLVESNNLVPGMFRCVIVDESHMLKNKNTKRTRMILPVLREAKRVVMLSGTPALAKPVELWPQLSVLGEHRGWWTDEADFARKYAKSSIASGNPTDAAATEEEREGSNNLAELHTLLTSTVMIRRMKANILKSLPKKVRSSAQVHITDRAVRKQFRECMALLREGNGVLGKLARDHHEEREKAGEGNGDGRDSDGDGDGHAAQSPHGVVGDCAGADALSSSPSSEPFGNPDGSCTLAQVHARINAECKEKLKASVDEMREKLRRELKHVSHLERKARNAKARAKLERHVRSEEEKCDALRRRRMNELRNGGGWYQGKRIVDWTGSRSGIAVSVAVNRKIAQMAAGAGEGPDGEFSRKAILSHLYSLTGMAKVPSVVGMLERWLAEPTRGKLCLFAHHISVLDEIAAGAGLNNDRGSRSRYVRIDGSTLPKARQEAVSSFQTDPGIRVALLGITAAGVAVTLTAASDVWFAELFWTPAMLIQAEDRCHRIGQQANVKCLYLIAKGTLDEVLWRLVEKKFRDLGEFVEGKEKLEMVIHKHYACGMDAVRDYGTDDENDEEGDETDGNSGVDSSVSAGGTQRNELDDLVNSGDIQHDIEELGLEEQAMVKSSTGEEGDDEDADGASAAAAAAAAGGRGGEGEGVGSGDVKSAGDAPPAAASAKGGGGGGGGNAEEETVIYLSDDDENDAPASRQHRQDEKMTASRELAPKSMAEIASDNSKHDGTDELITFDDRVMLPNLRFYRISFPGPQYGLVMAPFKGRPVITRKHPDRVRKLGPDVKPEVGDILISINGATIPVGLEFNEVLRAMKVAIDTGHPVEIVFGEDPDFKAFYRDVVLPREERRTLVKRQNERAAARAGMGVRGNSTVEEQRRAVCTVEEPLPTPVTPASNVTTKSRGDGVIELLDDD